MPEPCPNRFANPTTLNSQSPNPRNPITYNPNLRTRVLPTPRSSTPHPQEDMNANPDDFEVEWLNPISHEHPFLEPWSRIAPISETRCSDSFTCRCVERQPSNPNSSKPQALEPNSPGGEILEPNPSRTDNTRTPSPHEVGFSNPVYSDSKCSNPILTEPTIPETHYHMRSDSRTLFT